MDETSPHARSLRKGRVSQAGQVYSVTAVCKGRESVFKDLFSARVLINVLRETEQFDRAKTHCFVVMPDHFHWLVQLGNESNLSTVVRAVKALSSKRIGHSIWQKGFYDHALRSEEDIKELARYIVANPLRGGLVESIGDYPHWDAMWL